MCWRFRPKAEHGQNQPKAWPGIGRIWVAMGQLCPTLVRNCVGCRGWELSKYRTRRCTKERSALARRFARSCNRSWPWRRRRLCGALVTHERERRHNAPPTLQNINRPTDQEAVAGEDQSWTLAGLPHGDGPAIGGSQNVVTGISRPRSRIDRILSDYDHPKSSEFGPPGDGPKSANLGPASSKPGPDSATFGPLVAAEWHLFWNLCSAVPCRPIMCPPGAKWSHSPGRIRPPCGRRWPNYAEFAPTMRGSYGDHAAGRTFG